MQEQIELMRHYFSREYLKRKEVDRWENEGGKICADEAALLDSNGLNEEEPVRESQILASSNERQPYDCHRDH